VKALLILLLVLGGVWLWRSSQASSSDSKPAAPPAGPPPEPLDMVRCSQCGMHVPGNEAIAGKQGMYCSVDPLRLSES